MDKQKLIRFEIPTDYIHIKPYDGFYIRMNNTQFTGDSVLEDKIEEEYLKKFDKNF